MKPRIIKKLSKKIVQMGHPIAKHAWLDNEFEYWGYYLVGDRKNTATAKQLRKHYDSMSTINNVWSIGGEKDYWGEPTDFYPVYHKASDYVLWKYGKPTVGKWVDPANGHIIAEVADWPVMKKRITGKLVISLLKAEIESPKGGDL